MWPGYSQAQQLAVRLARAQHMSRLACSRIVSTKREDHLAIHAKYRSLDQRHKEFRCIPGNVVRGFDKAMPDASARHHGKSRGIGLAFFGSILANVYAADFGYYR